MDTRNHPVLEALRQRRSIRRFTKAPVATEDIRTVLEAGRWAPSGLNNQPWRFLVLTRGDHRIERLAGLSKYAHVFRGAAAVILVFLEKARMYHPVKDHQVAGAAVQNMLLAVHALGLGAVWLGEIINHEQQAMPALGLDAGELEFMAAVALGHPDQQGSSDRRPLDDMLLEDF